jgi:hypothetical protein
LKQVTDIYKCFYITKVIFLFLLYSTIMLLQMEARLLLIVIYLLIFVYIYLTNAVSEGEH